MTDVLFYEKPGCKTNNRQKALLKEAGYSLSPRSILEEPWDKDTLKLFMTGRPVVDWFNPAAPAVKAGEVIPAELDEDQALEQLLAEPILIRRPLLATNKGWGCGFESAMLQRIGLGAVIDLMEGEALPQGCSKTTPGACGGHDGEGATV